MNTENTTIPEATPLLVRDRAAAQLLSMGCSTFWREVKAGNLPQPVKIGSLTRWRVSDLRSYVESPASSPTTLQTALIDENKLALEFLSCLRDQIKEMVRDLEGMRQQFARERLKLPTA